MSSSDENSAHATSPRNVITYRDARYFDAKLGEQTLVPGDDASSLRLASRIG